MVARGAILPHPSASAYGYLSAIGVKGEGCDQPSPYFLCGRAEILGHFPYYVCHLSLSLICGFAALIVASGASRHQTEKCRTEKWGVLFFCPTFFCLKTETMIKTIPAMTNGKPKMESGE